MNQDIPIQIRPMEVDDLEAIMIIERDNFPYPWSQGNFTDSLSAGYHCLVMLEKSQLIGYAVMMMVLDEAHLLNISVHQSKQGHGMGYRLLQHIMALGRRLGGLNLFLEVRPSNHSALKLYERAGFNEMGIRPSYYPAKNGREDAVLMGMSL
jgi:[ribosomal protein S18]-alanine N-acetyltransferase